MEGLLILSVTGQAQALKAFGFVAESELERNHTSPGIDLFPEDASPTGAHIY
jgi:hypothetical protein